MQNKKRKFNKSKKLIQTEKKYLNVQKLSNKIAKNLVNSGAVKLKNHRIFLTLFGCGEAKTGGGTIASAVTTIFWWFITHNLFINQSIILINFFWFCLVLFSFIYGCFISSCYEQHLGIKDPQFIVIDEFVGQILALQISYPIIKDFIFAVNNLSAVKSFFVYHAIFGFIIFRILDVYKPSIIGKIDANVKGGLGIMLDDLVSGIFAAIFTILLVQILFG